MDDELLDLVNEKDEVIGTIFRNEYGKLVTQKLGYIRAVSLFIQNDNGELWIPRRTLNKKIAPGGLDSSMEGHLGSGENYLDAALRETREELNLDLKKTDLKFFRKFEPSIIPYFRKVYLYHSNNTPKYNPNDFVSAAWLTPSKIIDMINSGTPAKLLLRETIEELIHADL